MTTKFKTAAFATALCALFAAQTEARTLYVDGSRPNNNGNGLTASTAKKTLQSAINIANDGDTIIVYPGKYSQISTANKAITIKSKDGASKTKIVRSASAKATENWIDWSGYIFTSSGAIAKLGKEMKKTSKLLITLITGAQYATVTYIAPPTGNATKLVGFTLDGQKDGQNIDCQTIAEKSEPYTIRKWVSYSDYGVAGGTVNSCIFRNCGNIPVAYNSKLVGCKFVDNVSESTSKLYSNNNFIDVYSGAYASRGAELSSFNRCTFTGNRFAAKQSAKSDIYSNGINAGYPGGFTKCNFYNCLFAGNKSATFDSCMILNCTIADNSGIALVKNKAYNTIFQNVAAVQFGSNRKNTLQNCFKGSGQAPKFVKIKSGSVLGDYRLASGSPCIHKGRLTDDLKKSVGSVDLAGEKRVKGSAIDIGCYER